MYRSTKDQLQWHPRPSTPNMRRRSWLWRRRIYCIVLLLLLALWKARQALQSAHYEFASFESQYTELAFGHRLTAHRHQSDGSTQYHLSQAAPKPPQKSPETALAAKEAQERQQDVHQTVVQDTHDETSSSPQESPSLAGTVPTSADKESQDGEEKDDNDTVATALSNITPIATSTPTTHAARNPSKTPYAFPSYGDWLALDAKAETLPNIVHIPLEEAVADEVLEGWEDKWFAHAKYDAKTFGPLKEPKIDFVYTWVNGSETAFAETMRPYELNSSLNDPEGEWIRSHGTNRYRDWDELRYTIRSVEQYAGSFRNKIQLLVNAVDKTRDKDVRAFTKQRPLWLNDKPQTREIIQVLSQEEFFGEEEQGCLPAFNSLTVEGQLHNTPSDVDRLVAMSDDMLLSRPHSASDFYSPLFGPTMGFKSNGYNTGSPPSETDARRFGEKPYLIYTSWMLNRRFGPRKRKGQVHFGHSLSRSVAREVSRSFPRPALRGACQRFRGETGFQLYTWYAAFHYVMERQRETLLWSYLMVRSDGDGDGNLGWAERQVIMQELEQGMEQEGKTAFRKRIFYHAGQFLAEAGLQPPKVNIDVLWTSLDGPASIRDVECYEFDVNECLAPGFSSPMSDERFANPVFSTATIFDRVARQDVKCGDCLIKLILNRVTHGLSPLLPSKTKHGKERETALKALKRYQYSIVEPDALFMMITDAEQVEETLVKRLLNGKRQVGQLCLNDDVATDDEEQLLALKRTMDKLFQGLLPDPSQFEL